MAAIQTTAEVREILFKLKGEDITVLQVLGINSLRSVSPMPEALAGEKVTGGNVEARVLTITTTGYRILVDLQRTGRLVWLRAATPYSMTPGAPRPTLRLLLASGAGLDFTEPAKTKRISVSISPI